MRILFKARVTKLCVVYLLTALMIVSIFTPTQFVFADNNANTNNGANDMQRSMIKFFRDDRVGLDVDKVSSDELLTYGVFISNFFVPGKTKVKDMTGDDLTKLISKKFFGSEDKATEVKGLNNKLQSAITDVLGNDPKTFALYSTSDNSKTDKKMSGETFFKKMFSTNKMVYGADGREAFNFGNDATRAVMQVMTGFAPGFFLDPSKGVRKMDSLYMDGLGNIWGSYKVGGNPAAVADYVLVLPACINPSVFSKTVDNSTKFPVTNAFVMGALVTITEDFLRSADTMTPYYNVKKYFTANSNNLNNMTSIYGITSPLDYIGDSDAIIKGNTNLSNPTSKVTEFVKSSSTAEFSGNDASILVTLDMDKFPSFEDHIKGFSADEKKEFCRYIFRASKLELSQLADEMFYFSGIQGANGDQGDWKDDASLVRGPKLFANTTSSGGYTFYANSYFSSPFNRMYLGFSEASDKKDYFFTWLKGYNKDFKESKSSSTTDYLYEFLHSGVVGNKKMIINNNLTYFFKNDSGVYNTVPYARYYSTLDKDGHLGTGYPLTYGLTDKDSCLAIMSWRVGSTSVPWTPDIKDHSPFMSAGDGGLLFEGLSKSDDNKVTSLFYSTLVYRLFSVNSTYAKGLSGGIKPEQEIKGVLGDFKARTAVANDVNNWPGIYWGYMVQILGLTMDGDKLSQGQSFSNPTLPKMILAVTGGAVDTDGATGDAGVATSKDKTFEDTLRDVLNKVNSLLTDGASAFRDNLINATLNGFVLSGHKKLIGNWGNSLTSVSSGANGGYGSVVGYINTPSLEDLPLTSWLTKDYMYVYMVLVLLVLMYLAIMFITRNKSFREVALLLVVMLFVLYLPTMLVGNVVKLSNSFGDKVFSSKFNFWALTQHEQAIKSTTGVNNSDLDYLISNAMQDSKITSTDAGVRLKWMSPKKDDVFSTIFNSTNMSAGLSSNMNLFRWLFNSTLNQEEYVYNDPLATYLYRPYSAIVREAYESFNKLNSMVIEKNVIAGDINKAKKAVADLPDYRFDAFNDFSLSTVKYSLEQKASIKNASVYTPAGADEATLSSYRFWAMANPTVTTSIFRSDFKPNSNAGLSNVTQDDYSHAFSLLSESPYYYFYNVLKARYNSISGGFSNSLMEEDLFKASADNPNIDGSIRDFLDLEGLFTYVIPYLNQGNIYVRGWTDKNGKDIEQYDFKSGVKGDTSDTDYLAAQAKKTQLMNVWKMYSPWVDQLYAGDVNNKGVKTAKKKVFVEDTLNPASYAYVGRPMIFSEADMYAKSFREGDLSTTEMKIQEVLDKTYTDLMYLNNYYDFDNEVLVSMGAMLATFNFNSEFSTKRIFGESNILYPQNFELKNFNYEAYLKMILFNSTGESIIGNDDIVNRVVSKTSFVTGGCIIAADILAVVAIPAFKMVIILCMLVIGVLVALGAVITPREELLKHITKNIVTPALLFLVSNSAFALGVSLFVGDGLTGYVGSRTPSLGMTDPTITLALLIIMDLVFLYILYKIIDMLIRSIKSNGLGVAMGLVAASVGFINSGISKIGNKAHSMADSTMRGLGAVARSRGRNRRHKEMLDAMSNKGNSEVETTSTTTNSNKSSSKDKDNNKNSNSDADKDSDAKLTEKINKKSKGDVIEFSKKDKDGNIIKNEDVTDTKKRRAAKVLKRKEDAPKFSYVNLDKPSGGKKKKVRKVSDNTVSKLFKKSKEK